MGSPAAGTPSLSRAAESPAVSPPLEMTAGSCCRLGCSPGPAHSGWLQREKMHAVARRGRRHVRGAAPRSALADTPHGLRGWCCAEQALVQDGDLRGVRICSSMAGNIQDQTCESIVVAC